MTLRTPKPFLGIFLPFLPLQRTHVGCSKNQRHFMLCIFHLKNLILAKANGLIMTLQMYKELGLWDKKGSYVLPLLSLPLQFWDTKATIMSEGPLFTVLLLVKTQFIKLTKKEVWGVTPTSIFLCHKFKVKC